VTVVGIVDALDPSAARGVCGAHPNSAGAADEAPQDGDGPKDDDGFNVGSGGGGDHGCKPINTWSHLVTLGHTW